MAAQPVCAISELNIVIWCIAAMIQVILSSHATLYLVSDAFLCAVALRKHFRALCSMSSSPHSNPRINTLGF